MKKILADESVDFRIIKKLREQGFEVEAIVEKSPSINDVEVLHQANLSGSILLTEDKDFGELSYRLKKESNGVILIRLSGVPIKTKIGKVLHVLNQYGEELVNAFVVISSEKIRIRPFR